MGSGCSTSKAAQPSEEPEKPVTENRSTPEAAQPSEEPEKTVTENPKNDAEATEKTEEVKLPHNYEAILKDADYIVDSSSTEKLYDQLYNGVFLNKKKKKYWVEKNSNNNCFMVFARDLSITWSEDNRHWHWPYLQETSDVLVDTAELLYVWWLEVHGKFETTKLTPGVLYEVVFVVMLRDPAYGWEIPVNLSLVLPDGGRQEHKENFMEKTRGQWIDIPAGEFRTSPEVVGEIEFSLYEYGGKIWKKGLVIKGVAIRPKA